MSRTVFDVTADGIWIKDGDLSRPAPLPQPLPEGATDVQWVPDENGLLYFVDGVPFTMDITEADVEAAKVWTPPVDIDAVLADLRKKRNELLAESDFSQLSDAPVDSAAWAVYRQELRDLPETVDPATGQFTWPTKPNA